MCFGMKMCSKRLYYNIFTLPFHCSIQKQLRKNRTLIEDLDEAPGGLEYNGFITSITKSQSSSHVHFLLEDSVNSSTCNCTEGYMESETRRGIRSLL